MTILDPGYAWFWITVSLLITAFFGWLLYRISSKIGQVADALLERNRQEAEWRELIDRSFYEESEGS